MSKDKKKKLQGFDKAVLKRVLTHIKKYRILVILSFVCAMITVASTLYAPILTGDAIDLIVGKGLVDFDGIKDIIYTFLMVTVVTVISQWFMNIINNHITYSVVRDIRIEVFNHMEELPLSYIDSHKHGDIVSRIVSDIDQFADGLLMGFTQLFTGIVTILATLGFMIAVNVPIALVVIVLTPLSLFVASFIAKRTYHLFHQQSETRGEITALVDEMVGQQKIVQAFGYEDDALDRFEEINNRLEKDSMSATFYSSLVNPCTRFVNNLVYAAVGIIGAISAIMTGLTVGQLTCFLSYANQYTKPFNEISNVITELQNAMACAGRVFELLDETPQVPEKENAHVLTDTKGAIEIKDVNFSYVKDKTLITNLNLSVKPGMRVAIVGPTGCGKSTLLTHLKTPLTPHGKRKGEILFQGVPIGEMSNREQSQRIGYVLQNPDNQIVTDKVWHELAFGLESLGYSNADIRIRVAEMASYFGIQDWFYKNVSELSGGQKQLLNLASIMAMHPDMLILDEPTSQLDPIAASDFLETVKKINRDLGTTIILTEHRLEEVFPSAGHG